jgi:hypothetical protein
MRRQFFSLLLFAGLLTAADPQPELHKGLAVSILQGDDVTHSISNPPPAHVSIRVTDTNAKPVTGAVAVFEFPESGPTALFSDSSNVKAVLTDSDGKASVEVHSNSQPGRFEPTVTVNYLGQTTIARLHQVNAPLDPVRARTITSGESHRKWYYLAAGGGAAVAVLLATRSKSSTANSPSSGGGIVITPGSGSVGGN